jgi:hypothetical protein
MSVLIDSDILMDVSRGRDTDLVSRWTGLSRSEVVILDSPVSAAELWAGARPAEHHALDNLFRALKCVPILRGNRPSGRRLPQTPRKKPCR